MTEAAPVPPPAAELAAVRCAGCGRPPSECDGCLPAFDPPRFCTTCGGRLRVQVTPAAYTTLCRSCAR